MADPNKVAFNMMQAATKDPFMEFMNTSRIEEENFQRRMPHLIGNKEKNFVQRILNPELNKGREALWEDKKTGESGTMTHFLTFNSLFGTKNYFSFSSNSLI